MSCSGEMGADWAPASATPSENRPTVQYFSRDQAAILTFGHAEESLPGHPRDGG